MSGKKSDAGKPEFDRLSFEALAELNKVHKLGDSKYDKGNWKEGILYSRILNAAIRHLTAILRGEYYDPESKLLHAAHAACNCEFLVFYMLNSERYKEYDDIGGVND